MHLPPGHDSLHTPGSKVRTPTGEFMAKPNYAHQKKQREAAARKKREEKLQRKQHKKEETPQPPA